MPTPVPMTKPECRAWAQATRATLDLTALSTRLCERLATLPAFQAAQHVLLYAATDSELDLMPLTDLPGKQFYLPRCAPKRRLAVHTYPCPLVLSPFGIREPAATEPESDLVRLDLVLVPALALTPTGERLGYGGGYYDRFLPRLSPETRTVGVVPEALLCPTLPSDPWDQRVKFVMTEAKFLQVP